LFREKLYKENFQSTTGRAQVQPESVHVLVAFCFLVFLARIRGGLGGCVWAWLPSYHRFDYFAALETHKDLINPQFVNFTMMAIKTSHVASE
jgi:hypothetical protein